MRAVLGILFGLALLQGGVARGDWRAKPGNQVTFPVGPTLSKVIHLGRLPVKLELAGQYMPIHPDDFGQKWNV